MVTLIPNRATKKTPYKRPKSRRKRKTMQQQDDIPNKALKGQAHKPFASRRRQREVMKTMEAVVAMELLQQLLP
jgi:hypothetical protein